MKRLSPLLLGLGLLISTGETAPGQAQRALALAPAEREFIERHWRRPIPPQGEAPSGFTPLEQSLAPADCGSCHPVQFRDWQGSIHSKSMGPGLVGQLVEMNRSDPAAARSCPACHAPLAEQSPDLPDAGGLAPNPAFDASLRRQGVVCAACHVRGHQRFGPPPRPGTTAAAPGTTGLPHGGATHTTAYLRSEFCSSCHQFGASGPILNGKPLGRDCNARTATCRIVATAGTASTTPTWSKAGSGTGSQWISRATGGARRCGQRSRSPA